VLAPESFVIHGYLMQRVLKARSASHLHLFAAGTAGDQQGKEELSHGLIQ
jgi:hypothetical protein